MFAGYENWQNTGLVLPLRIPRFANVQSQYFLRLCIIKCLHPYMILAGLAHPFIRKSFLDSISKRENFGKILLTFLPPQWIILDALRCMQWRIQDFPWGRQLRREGTNLLFCWTFLRTACKWRKLGRGVEGAASEIRSGIFRCQLNMFCCKTLNLDNHYFMIEMLTMRHFQNRAGFFFIPMNH